MAPWHVTDIAVVAPLTLSVRFADGTEGRARLEPGALTGAFAPLADPEVFGRASVCDGAVTWPGELDLAPDAMHDEIAAGRDYVFR